MSLDKAISNSGKIKPVVQYFLLLDEGISLIVSELKIYCSKNRKFLKFRKNSLKGKMVDLNTSRGLAIGTC